MTLAEYRHQMCELECELAHLMTRRALGGKVPDRAAEETLEKMEALQRRHPSLARQLAQRRYLGYEYPR